MKPTARSNRLVKQVVDQEILVYDQADDTACCLNSLASAVWNLCDGERTVEEIAAAVAADVVVAGEVDPETAVWGALNELAEHNLVDFGGGAEEAGIHRREALKVAVVGLALFPTIKSVVAPTVAMAQSPAASASASASSEPAVTPTNTPTNSVTPTNTPTSG